jgi:hypothetical protein
VPRPDERNDRTVGPASVEQQFRGRGCQVLEARRQIGPG